MGSPAAALPGGLRQAQVVCFTRDMATTAGTHRGPTTKELRKLADRGATLRPVFGAKDPVHYEPRTKFDPQPWTDGVFRYHAWELTPDEEGNQP